MRSITAFFSVVILALALAGCGEKDEEKAAQNRPAIPGY
jgi:predicted small lipoprotein YifL